MAESTPYDHDGPETPWDDNEPTDDELDEIGEDEETEFQSSMQDLVASYEAEQDEFNEAEDEFFQTYGFRHKCRCAQDWDESNLGVVSECYLNMVNEAMELLADRNKELKSAKREIAKLRISNAG